jgi:hypothetical protein
VKLAEKPSHNQYDNIWEIRTRPPGYPPQDWLRKVQKGPPDLPHEEDLTKVGRGLLFSHVEDFCRALLFTQIKLPVWKIVIPPRDKGSGAIYYIAENTKGQSYCFRGTYGYAESGPHEAAKIEAILEARGLTVALRSGDYLLQFFTEEDRPVRRS